jgi:hypothetical protein
MTKNELIAQYKTDYPTLTKGVNDEILTLDAQEYEATIAQWADNQIAKEEAEKSAEAAKESAQAKLAALGLTTDDLKALGLGNN